VLSLDQWEQIRLRCVRDGEPIKAVARDLGMAPNTVRKYVRSQQPPGKVSISRARRLDRYEPAILELLRSTPRITASRIGSVLREQYDSDLTISERALRQFVARCRGELVPKEAFVRARYVAGDQAQFDFSPMRALIAGEEIVLHVFIMRLSYSGHFFARASRREDQPSLFAGLLDAVKFFGGVPRVAIFDNAKTAVQRILKGREREENATFRAFRGALALQVEYAAPRSGNQKGGVEGYVGFVEDNFFRPMPSYESVETLNIALHDFATKKLNRQSAQRGETVLERFGRERAVLRPVPEELPEPCIREYARVNKFGEVIVGTNRYSVPTRFVARHAFADVYDTRVIIRVDGVIAAEHPRVVGKHGESINLLHYVELISRKHRSAVNALAFADGRLPKPLTVLRDRLIERDGPTGTKTWMAILRLAMETSLEALTAATEVALSRGTLDPQAIALLLRRPREVAPAADGTLYRPTPAGRAQVIDLEAYRMNGLVERLP
jgi:transposase